MTTSGATPAAWSTWSRSLPTRVSKLFQRADLPGPPDYSELFPSGTEVRIRVPVRIFLLPGFVLGVVAAFGAQHSGSVRAADQFIPGATVTARQGAAKVVAYTDEAGRYTLDLTPGTWQIDIEMFGLSTLHSQVDASEPTTRDWT